MSLWLTRRALPSAYAALTRYEDPFFSNMSHCANAIRSAFVASAGRQMVSSTGSGSTDSISDTHGSTGRRIPEGKAATQIEPQDRRGIDWITQIILTVNRASILRDFAGLESPERICGPLPDQTRIRPYFWTESDSGVPSDSPPKLTGKKKLLESLPKPLIFNIFRQKKMDAGLILAPLPE